MFGWLKRKKSEKEIFAEIVTGWQEERVKTSLDTGRVERDNKERAADPEQIELEDTVRSLLHPKPEEVTPEPADDMTKFPYVKGEDYWVKSSVFRGTGWRWRLSSIFFSIGARILGYKWSGETRESDTVSGLEKVEPLTGHHHVQDNRYSTGIENARLEKDRNEVLKIQSTRAAALANEPVRKQLAARGQEENPEQYTKDAEKIPLENLSARLAPTMSEAIDEHKARDMQEDLVGAAKASNPAFSAEATKEENAMKDAWASKGVHPDAFNAGAEEDLRRARSLDQGQTPGAQGNRPTARTETDIMTEALDRIPPKR